MLTHAIDLAVDHLNVQEIALHRRQQSKDELDGSSSLSRARTRKDIEVVQKAEKELHKQPMMMFWNQVKTDLRISKRKTSKIGDCFVCRENSFFVVSTRIETLF